MCWSAQASFTTFCIGSILSLILIIRNAPYDRLFGIFFLWVILMQLLEYLMWRDVDCKGNLNNVASQMAWFQNLTQPIVGGLLILAYVYTGQSLKDKNKKSPLPFQLFCSILVAYTFTFLWWIFTKKPYKDKFCAQPCDDHHLQWPWAKKENYGSYIWISYYIAFAAIIIASLRNKAWLILSAYLVVTCLIAALFLPFSKSMGSWWCVFAIGGPLLKLFLPVSMFDQPLVY